MDVQRSPIDIFNISKNLRISQTFSYFLEICKIINICVIMRNVLYIVILERESQSKRAIYYDKIH